MGGVDIADQLRSYYNTQLTSFRTWWPMLFWALDTMLTNAYLIYSDIEGTPNISHKEFRLQCTWELILAFPSPIKMPKPTEKQPAKVKEDSALPPDRHCNCGHSPIHLDMRQTCWLCRWNHRGQGVSDNLPKTHWACERCDKPLCLSDKRNCFKELHVL